MGRKKIEDRNLVKENIQVQVEQFKIDKLGGNDSAKKFVINAINEKTDEK